ncbi:hypothetical protein LO772_04880 [Yinghuangia sp. ASG 101]|uniref:hypothetical protein n=1 Tax=Yinghuangia sp. ASG 101 TaxID=2896848 RepID=UPI001E51BD84|nr:hypothetical protein [Yinghuangia sp. ASG 101]UGQ12959.1 hypothetical protein LO772_04880 [Yinghuangia sp. ASG 101]
MSKFLLILHVLAAIVAIGPVTVAASRFPQEARRALADPADPGAVSTVRQLHRICTVYAYVGVAVPILGIVTGASMGVLGSTWLTVSMMLTAFAAVVLGGLILPGQSAIVARLYGPRTDAGPLPGREATVRLAMLTGVFNLLWAAVTILMIVRPGSTTGA